VDRCALFVDAGYVLADGAMAVHGTRQRESVSWDYAGLVKLLTGVSRDRTGLPVLRCYWYEATVEGRRSSEHNALADLPGVKLRMGRMRPGRREGVEAEMHRDLTTLARNHAVSDAVIVSAEEDLAEVVAEVQDLGLRVIIVHIAADGNWTVSRPLRQECDDIVEVTAAHLRPFVDLISGAEPAGHDDQYLNGSYQRRSISNGHGAGIGAMTHQGMPAAALPAPPAIYTGPVVEEYHRTAQPPGQGPLALSALAAAAAVGPPPNAHHPAAPAPAAPPQAQPPAQPDVPGRRPVGAQPANGPAAPNSASPQAQTGPQPQVVPPPGVPHGQAGAPAPSGASALAGQPLAAPTPPSGYEPSGYGAGPGDQPGAHGGYAFMPSQGADGGRSAAGPGQPEPAPGRDAAPVAQPAPPQAVVPQNPVPPAAAPPAPAQQAPMPQAPMPQAPMPRELAPQNQAAHNGLPPNAVPQNGMPQNPLPHDLGHVGHNPVQASPAQPFQQQQQPPPPQPPQQQRQDEQRFAPGQNDYRTPDQPGPRGAAPGRDGIGAPGPDAARPPAPPAPYAENGAPARFAENGGSSRFAENGGPGRFGENPLPGRFAEGPAPSRFAEGPAQARFGDGPGSSRFAEGAAPSRFGEGPGPSRFSEGSGQPQPPYPSAPPGAFGAGSAAQVQYPQFPGPAPGQHAAPASDAGYPAPQRDQGPYSGPQPAAHSNLPQPVSQPMAISLADAVQAAHAEGFGFGDAVARDAPALWLEAVLARKPRMPSDLEARLLQGSALPIDSLLHDEVRHSLRRGFWDALERSRR
jgi:NYN domain